MRPCTVSAAPDHAVRLPNLDTIIRGLLYVYIACLPFRRLLFVERNGFLILIALLVIWCAVNRRHFFTRTPIDLPLLVFVAWVAVTIPFAAFPDYSLKEFTKLLQQGLIFYVVAYFFQDGARQVRLLRVLIGTSLVVSGYGVFEFMGMAGIVQSEGKLRLLESVTAGEVWLTTYLVLVIPLCFALFIFGNSRYERRMALGATILAAVCLILTFSRAGFLALMSELGGLVWVMRQKVVMVAAALVGLLVGLVMVVVIYSGVTTVPGTEIPVRGVSASSLTHRIDIWQYTLARIVERPLTGFGYGKETFKLVNEHALEASRSDEERAQGHAPILQAGTHNIFLDLAFGVGLPGLVLSLWLIQRLLVHVSMQFRQSESPITKALLLGAGVSIMGLGVRLCFDQMLVGTLALQACVMVALAMAACRANESVGRREQDGMVR